MTEAENPVSTAREGATLVVTIDDGKANAISHVLLDGLEAALDEAEADGDVRAVVVVGREGKFSAGFDLSVMQSGMDAARALLRRGAELALRVYLFPKPVVIGCTGHALAMAAILLLAADVRIGADAPAKIGLNEVAIGMPLPRFGVELARDRLDKAHFVPAVQHARIYDPAGAVEAGYLDRVVAPDAVVGEAVAHAEQLAATLRTTAFVLTRRFARADLAEQIRDRLDEDVALFDLST